VILSCRRREIAGAIARGEHPSLPGAPLPAGIATALFGEALPAVDFVISTVPTQRLREVLRALRATLPLDVPWVSGSKGLEIGTQRLPSEILVESGVRDAPAVLSGPSHAEEVVREVPTAVSLGDRDGDRAAWLQNSISEKTFRVYTNTDPIGVEWGGALKNVVALASGIAIGQGFGDNTLAALVSRGAVEIARLGVALGGRRETFSGLSGIGDLIVTCFSAHSRNRAFGIRVGRGEDPRALLAASQMVVEGVHTCRAVHELRETRSIEMPIAECVHRIVHEGGSVADGVRSLLARSLKEE
jgi:glycerol-3-phosphate dehydrogenase (NAD(P)+)